MTPWVAAVFSKCKHSSLRFASLLPPIAFFRDSTLIALCSLALHAECWDALLPASTSESASNTARLGSGGRTSEHLHTMAHVADYINEASGYDVISGKRPSRGRLPNLAKGGWVAAFIFIAVCSDTATSDARGRPQRRPCDR